MNGILLLLFVSVSLGVATVDICENEGDVRIWVAPVIWRIKREYVQICSNSSGGIMKWRYVCDSGWTRYEAMIACTQLGYVGVRRTNRRDWYYSVNDEIVTDLNCDNRNATSFSECSFDVSRQSCKYVRGLKCERCDDNSGCVSGQCRDGQCECAGPCLNGAACRFGACECPVGFWGVQCEECNATCLNGGECSGVGQCACKQGYYGDACEFKECLDECLNNGTCLPNGTCKCSYGYKGEYCENVFDESALTTPLSLPTATEQVTTHWKENSSTQTKTTVRNEESSTALVLPTDPGLERIHNFLFPSKIDIYTAGFIMMAVSSGIILVLCCCHFLVIIPFMLMRRRQRRYKFVRVEPSDAFYEPSQTVVASNYQIPMTHENSPNTGIEKLMENSGDGEIYTEMKLIYDNREIIGQEVLKGINAEKRKKRRVLFLEQSNQLYVQMSPVL